MALGNTLTTFIGNDPTPTVTHRDTSPPPPDESDNDFIDRHCDELLRRIQGETPTLTNALLVAPLEPQSGWTAEDLIASFKEALQEAA